MARVLLVLRLVLALLAHVRGSADVRLLDAAGSFSNVGLLQVRMDADFGTVCGANAAAADVIICTNPYIHLFSVCERIVCLACVCACA